MIYMRHGTPSDRSFYAAPGVEPNESWGCRPDGDLVFHFVSREDVQDYKLVESLLDIFGYATARCSCRGPPPPREQLHHRGAADLAGEHVAALTSG